MAKKKHGKAGKPATSKNRHNAPRKGSGARKEATASKDRTRRPRQAALIEDARISAIDKVLDSIADCRDNINDLRGEEKGYLSVVRKLMHQHGKTIYKHAGVECALVPGDEKVRVRILKDSGDASSSGADDNGGDDGDVLDAGGDNTDIGTGSDEALT